MKKLLIFLFTIWSVASFAQSGSLSQSVYRSRVNDSTSVTTPAGYGLLYYNNQRIPGKWLFSNDQGATWHELGSGGAGGTPSFQDVLTVSSVLTSPVAITSADPVSISTDDGAGHTTALVIDPNGESSFIRNDATNLSGVDILAGAASTFAGGTTHGNAVLSADIVSGTTATATLSASNNGAANTTSIVATPTALALTINNLTGSNGDVLKKTAGVWGFSPDAGGSVSGSGTTNELSYWSASSTLGSLTTATYPSLTELSYVKGLTSSAQTQLTAKAPLASPTFTGTPSLPTGTTAVTQSPGDNTTKISTTAFVTAGLATVAGYTSTAPEIISASISGQTMKGRVLTCNKFYRDIDGTAESGTTFQWVRADDASGTNVANIASATSSTYTLVTADNTKYIACKVTPANAGETGSVYTTAYVGAVDDTYYPADQSGIVISFGIKKMAAAYAGNCIQIQLTNGGPTTNIGFDGNGDLDWATVSSTAGGGNAYLKIWYDQSGNGFNMIFSAFAKQPLVNYTARRIEWVTTNDATVTHNAAMNIGTGDFSFFMEATQRSLMDATFTFFEKKTSFSAQNWQLYSPIGVGMLMYTGDASVNTLTAPYSTPDRRSVIAGYRSSTAKFLNTDGVVKTSSETALTLTSTTDIKFNTGDGGTGEWYMWSWTFYTANKGSDYSKYKKFVSPDSL